MRAKLHCRTNRRFEMVLKMFLSVCHPILICYALYKGLLFIAYAVSVDTY